jgi:hypothetical protein
LTKCGLGYILGDFFTNSSGHPGLQVHAKVIEKIEELVGVISS